MKFSNSNYLIQNRNGFSLVEMMIVVGILGILAAIAVPAYRGYVSISKQKAAESTLNTIPLLIEDYRAENAIMCPKCNANGVYTYSYTETDAGVENTANPDKISSTYPDFKAKDITADATLYHYNVTFTVIGCPGACQESAVATAIPVSSRGAPAGNIVSKTYR